MASDGGSPVLVHNASKEGMKNANAGPLARPGSAEAVIDSILSPKAASSSAASSSTSPSADELAARLMDLSARSSAPASTDGSGLPTTRPTRCTGEWPAPTNVGGGPGLAENLHDAADSMKRILQGDDWPTGDWVKQQGKDVTDGLAPGAPERSERGVVMSTVAGESVKRLRRNGDGNDGGLADLPGARSERCWGMPRIQWTLGRSMDGDSTGLKAGLAAAEFTGMNGIADWKDGKDIAGTPLTLANKRNNALF